MKLNQLIQRSTGIRSNLSVGEHKLKHLEEIQKRLEGLQHAKDPRTEQPLLLAKGRITIGDRTYEPLTAIGIKAGADKESYDVEFATNVGKIQNTESGVAALNELNKRFRGKFVALESEEPTHVNIIYNERRPSEFLNTRKRLLTEIVSQAQTVAITAPVFEAIANRIGQQVIDKSVVDGTKSTIETAMKSFHS